MSTSESRSAAVLELAEEFLERYRQGERPSLKEYINRHPELAGEIKEVFPAMALMENVALAEESLAGPESGAASALGETPPMQLGDFRLLREVGRGGMGIVYEAEQVSLGRHVALKVLPRKVLLDAAQKQRFEREARAAARLHHTNIVPVFGVGEHDGLAYYVMQFIQGLGLDEVLRELKHLQGGSATKDGEPRQVRREGSAADVARSLLTGDFQEPIDPVDSLQDTGAPCGADTCALSSSLKLPGSGAVAHGKTKQATYWQSVALVGVQVAGALEYAHKQGIIHRDIKPSNLLLDARGTTWVTDFGLARSDNEDHLTHTGDIVGTLRYLPPEAFEGRADKRGDVYSLGLTLYELLALKPAFDERDRRRLIKRVTTEEPPRLDKENPSIPRDLATIVHKAIDREPARRYACADEMAADLQRFLDDEPIRARPISGAERLLRWCRRNPQVTGLTATLAATLLIVTIVSLIAAARFDGLAREQSAAAQSERRARREADDAKKQAENNLDEAHRQQQRAEANFATALRAVEDSFVTISENQLLKVPGMQPLRRDLLQSALAFYRDFLKQRGDDPTLRGELATAYLRLGIISAELGQGAEAVAAWEKARDLFETLSKSAPTVREWQHGLALCYFRLGRNDEAVALWEKLVQPGLPRFQKELALAYYKRGADHVKANRMEQALTAYQQALVIRKMLARLQPDDPNTQSDLAATLNSIGVLLDKKGRPAEALAMYQRAVEHAESAFARTPQAISHGRDLAGFYNDIAQIELRLGRLDRSSAAYRRAIEVWQKLARNNPAVAGLYRDLYAAYRTLALHQRERHQREAARQTMRQAREAIERLPREGADALFELARVRAECSTFLAGDKEQTSAEALAEQKREADGAMQTLRQAMAAGFDDLQRFDRAPEWTALRGRADFKALRADLAARTAAAPDRLRAGQQALAQNRKRAQADPKDSRLQADLAASEHAIALIQFDLGKRDAGRKHLEQAVALREALVADEPANRQYQSDLALSRSVLGDVYWQNGQLIEGTRRWRQSRLVLETILKKDNDDPLLKGQLASLLRRVGAAYGRVALWSEASAALDSAFAVEPDYPEGFVWFARAALALQLGQRDRFRQILQDFDRLPSRGEHWHWMIRLNMLAPGGFADAGAVVKAAERESPNAASHWNRFLLGTAHFRAGHYSEAERFIRESMAPALKPRYLSHRWFWLAMLCQRQGKLAEAKQWLDKGVRWLEQGRTAQPPEGGPDDDRWAQALELRLLRREAELLVLGTASPEPLDVLLRRAGAYVRLEQPKKAAADLKKIERATPARPELWKERARLYLELGQIDKAAADFREAAQLLGEQGESKK